jgi:hypothetical protein
MKQNWQWVLVIAAFLGWLLDFLFWRQAPGANFSLYALLSLAGGLAAMRLENRRMASGAAWLVPLIVVFTGQVILRAEPLTVGLGVMLTLGLLILLAASFTGGRWWRYGVIDYVLTPLRLGWSMLTRPAVFISELQQGRSEAGAGAGNRRVWPVLRGILLAVPILLVFGALLSSADLVFGRELTRALQALQLQRLPEYVFRLAYIAAAAYALTGVFLHAATLSADQKVGSDGVLRVPRLLGATEACIVLGSVAVLFAAFVLIQFQYFFGGPANINIEGYTYAEYARRGFGELVVVASFSLLLIMALGAATRRQSVTERRVFSALSVAIVVLVGVMLFSAYQRLNLYEAAYGFSRLRTYVHVLLVWLGLLLGAVAVLELVRNERLFATAVLIGALGFALSLSVLNVDSFIVRQNLARAAQGEQLDAPYLVSLSTDADPALAALLDSAALPPATREAVGAVLACRVQLNERRPATDWRSWTVSRSRSAWALHSLGPVLTEYHFPDADYPAQVLGPSGVAYSCLGSPD